MAMSALERQQAAAPGEAQPRLIAALRAWRPSPLRLAIVAAAAGSAATMLAAGASVWLLVAAGLGAAGATAFAASGARALAPPAPGPPAQPVSVVTLIGLLDTVPEPMVVIDDRDVVFLVNRAAGTILPLLKAGAPLYRGLRAPDILEGIATARALREPIGVRHVEVTPVERRFDVEIAPLSRSGAAEGPERPAVVLWFHDRTAARRLDAMRSDFIAYASHELRTPLATILGFIDTLQGPARDDKAARERFLDIMREQARRMARLIDDLLSLSRIEMSEHLRPTGRVALEPLIGHVLDTLAPLAEEQKVAVDFVPAGDDHWITADRDEILRVFENLVENAMKYGSSGGRIEITVEEHAEAGGKSRQVAVAVRDHGPGIAPEHLPRLTERFYRADVAESRGKGGTGLGLAIVKHIMTRHGGRLAIESELGKGATFRVIFPLAAGQ